MNPTPFQRAYIWQNGNFHSEVAKPQAHGTAKALLGDEADVAEFFRGPAATGKDRGYGWTTPQGQRVEVTF